MKENNTNYISATALAKRHNISSKEMFVYLVNHGYIERRGDVWSLTNEGIQAGGRFVKGKQFGKYIVWPEDLNLDIQVEKLITTVALAKQVGLDVDVVFEILRRISWVLQAHNGYLLTQQGKEAGGLQDNDPKKNENIVRWPKDITTVEPLRREILAAGGVADKNDNGEMVEKRIPQQRCEWVWRADDGHFVMNEQHGKVDNFLFAKGIVHSYLHTLDEDEGVSVHFYLPLLQSAIYIRPSGANKNESGHANGPLRLSCKKHGIRMIELSESEEKAEDFLRAALSLGR